MFAASIVFSAVAGLALLGTPASAKTYAGYVDKIEACKRQYGQNAQIAAVGTTAGDWRCRDNQGLHYPDVDSYCEWKYGFNEGRPARSDSQKGGFFDWGCFWG